MTTIATHSPCRWWNRAEMALGVAFWFASMAAISLSTYWLYFDTAAPVEFPPDKQINEPIREYRAGDSFTTHRYSCIGAHARGTVRRFFEDGIIYRLPDITASIIPSGCRWRSYQMTIPNIPPGEYVYRVETEFQLNPLSWVKVESPPVKLIVLPSKP